MKDKKDFPFQKLEFVALAFGLLALVSFFVTIIIFYYKTTSTNFHSTIDSGIWANLGNFLSGVVGSIFSIVTVMLLYMAYRAEKKELEATRKVMVEQSDALKKQQFENNFFKLLDIHSHIIKNFDDKRLAKADLDTLSKRHEELMRQYKLSLASKKIFGITLFNYHPFEDSVFSRELIKKSIDDISHISDFILSKSYLSEEDVLFYFMTFFNSLFDSEKYFYGIQSDLRIQKLLSANSELINTNYNDYYSQLDEGLKIKYSDAKDFYPTIKLTWKNERDQENITFLGMHLTRPILILKNDHSEEITLGTINITNSNKIHLDNSFLFKDLANKTLRPKEELRIDLFEFIEQYFFGGNLLSLLSPAYKAPQMKSAFEKIEAMKNTGKYSFVLHLPVKSSTKVRFDYYTELLLQLPFNPTQFLNCTISSRFSNELITQLMLKDSLKYFDEQSFQTTF